MSNKNIPLFIVIIIMVLVIPCHAETEKKDLKKMDMDELTILEKRLKKYLHIKQLEEQIDDVGNTKFNSNNMLDSTSIQPPDQPTFEVNSQPIPVPSPEPQKVIIKYKPLIKMPKILSIKGEVGRLTAELELSNNRGILSVKISDSILNNTYTVHSITSERVELKSKRGKIVPLAFKPPETIVRVTESSTTPPNIQDPNYKPIFIGTDSTFSPSELSE